MTPHLLVLPPPTLGSPLLGATPPPVLEEDEQRWEHYLLTDGYILKPRMNCNCKLLPL